MTDPTPLLKNDTKGDWNMYGSARDYATFDGSPTNAHELQQNYETQQFSVKYLNDTPKQKPSQNPYQTGLQQSSGENRIMTPDKPILTSGSKEWIPDQKAPFCTSCHKAFNWRFRRHHCRICGRVYCANCSQLAEIEANDEVKKMIVCKKDLQLHTQFNSQVNKQRLLLRDQVTPQDRILDSNQFVDFGDRGSFSRNSLGKSQEMAFKSDMQDLTFSSGMRRGTVSKPISVDSVSAESVAQISKTNKEAMEKFLEKNSEDSTQIFDQRDTVIGVRDTTMNPLGNQGQPQRKDGEKIELRDSMAKWIDRKLMGHIQQMIDQVITEFKIDPARWKRMMIKSTQNAVQTIRPSSRLLNDSIDFNTFIKIITLEYPDQSKCQYVNGVVFKKDVAHRRMRTEIDNPRVLILGNSLGYVMDDESLVDLSAEINQENFNMQIIMKKIQSINPHIIFVEQEASRLALETLFKDQRTVVTNVPPKMMKMIARLTQTIICPSTNLIDQNFIVGSCLKFRMEHIEPLTNFAELEDKVEMRTLREQTSLMYLEGCQSKLGCSIVISGPDLQEIKTVRMALKKCLQTARVFMLEREYLMFIKPDPTFYLEVKPPAEEEERKDDIIFEDLNKQDLQLMAAQHWDRRKDPEFKQLSSPFLYDKEMKRNFLVFECFSLIAATAKNETKHNDLGLSDNNPTEQSEWLQTSFEQHLTQMDTSMMASQKAKDEATIKHQINKMCGKPQRQQIQFYSEASDISVYQMIKRLATSAQQPCENKDCKKLRLHHSDYYYHRNGSVEIRYREEDSTRQLTDQDDYPIFVFCYCNQCKSLTLPKQEVPTQMLEMSFFKLLEQFFYNETINRGGQCPHNFHRDTSMIFCYGPIKIMLSFELLDEYVIDLQHFGATPGIHSQESIKESILFQFGEMQKHLTDAFGFADERTKLLQEWLKLAKEEFTVFIGASLSPPMAKMIAFTEELLVEIAICRDKIFKELFGAEQMAGFDEVKTTRLIDRIQTEMQVNRVLMHVGRRLSELIYLIRKAHILVTGKLLPKLFGKRNPFEKHQKNQPFSFIEPYELRSSQTGLSQQESSLRPQLSKAGTKDSFALASKPSMGRDAGGHLSVDQQPKHANSNKNEDEQLTGPSTRLKDSYLEIADFEAQLKANREIKLLVAELALDCGYDENKVSVNNQDIGSIIAYALNSNLYVSGLAKVEYMQIQENIKVFRDRPSDLQKNSTEFAVKQFTNNQAGNGVVLAPDHLNNKITMSMAENELLRENNMFVFVISGSTSMPAEIQVQSRGQDLDQIGMEEQRFFRQGEGIELQTVTVPIQENLLRKIVQLECIIERIRVSQQQVNMGTRSKKQLDAPDEIDFAQIALQGTQVALANSTKAIQGQPSALVRPKPLDVQIQVLDNGEDPNETLQDMTINLLADIHSDVYHRFHPSLDFNVKIYFPNQFEALRKVYCGSYVDFIRSIYKSEIWKDNSGGKSQSQFLKSHDHKYVIKVVRHSEIKMFETMGDSYFEYMCRSFTQQNPTALSKILGIFRIRMRVGVDGKATQTYCILMENLLLGVDESVAIKYDLKGSERNRYVAHNRVGQVTLDTNFLYDRNTRPIPMQFQMKKIFRIAVANDSLYLAQHQIIDYSLFLIIDPVRKKLRVGIIDYIQLYTIEKELESYIKQTVSNIKPTIIGPDQYKARFRHAMDKYFIALVPDEDVQFNQVVQRNFQKVSWFTQETDLYLTQKDSSIVKDQSNRDL